MVFAPSRHCLGSLCRPFAVGVVIMTLPDEMRIVSALPWWLERGLLLLGGVRFVNLVNFMDGIDWMTIAEIVPITAGLALLGSMGALPCEATEVAFALCARRPGSPRSTGRWRGCSWATRAGSV